MKTVAIIQARFDSQRLPGKVLEKIGDKTVLGWVVYRTRQIKLDEIVVATTDRPVDDPIVEECHYLDVDTFRGSADDVLDRYYQCAKQYAATHILRVTADCPRLDPGLNQKIIDLLVASPQFFYVASEGWPEGVGQEAFTYSALARADVNARSRAEREHVVPYMIRNFNCRYIRQDWKHSIDTPQELEHLRALYNTNPKVFDVSSC